MDDLMVAQSLNPQLAQVLDLQKVWEASNSDQMKLRGVLIRYEITGQLSQFQHEMAKALGLPTDEVGIEGRDGTGLKTEIPWVRVYAPERSPSATTGWYVVYLFGAAGDRVYLSLNQGTTEWSAGAFKPRKAEELKRRVDWARRIIGSQTAGRRDLASSIRLNARTSLGRGYEAGNVLAIEYGRDTLPSLEVLREDILFMCSLLGALYKAETSGIYIPGDIAPEVTEAKQSAARAAGRRTKQRSGQGFLLTSEERRAIEIHSVRLATKYFEDQGWKVKDVGATESYDLLLTRDGDQLHVEVKGTTSEGAQVILTRSEVERQRQLAPRNALIVVRSIQLDRNVKPVTADGGVLHCTSPWFIEDDSLTVISYIHRTDIQRQ